MANIPHSTLVVVDRCVLLQRPEALITQSEGIVIPDAYIAEMAEGTRTEKEPGQFLRWVQRFADRIYIGGYWWDLLDHERSCNRKATVQDAIKLEQTRWLREVVRDGRLPDWRGEMTKLAAWREHGYMIGRDRFLEMAGLFRKWIDKDQPDWWAAVARGKATHEERIKFIRQSDLSAAIAPIWLQFLGYDHMRYRSEPWQRELDVFPDRCAIGRWARLILWYMVKWAADETSGFENHWDDIHYGLIASYTGHLATYDKVFAEAIRAVFPNCLVRSGA